MKRFFKKIFSVEKRKYKRFNIDNCKLLIYDANSPREKEILDLSSKGISILYTDEGKSIKDIFEVDIKVNDIFHLGKVRAKTISDRVVSEFVAKGTAVRRLNAKFLDIHPMQEAALKKFLKTYGKRPKI